MYVYINNYLCMRLYIYIHISAKNEHRSQQSYVFDKRREKVNKVYSFLFVRFCQGYVIVKIRKANPW